MAIVDGGVAADDFAGFDIVGNAALGRGYGAVADGAVAGNTDLAGEDDGFADGCGSGESDLSAEEGIRAYGRAVAYLNEIVDLGPGVDAGFADGGAVDAGIGLNFDGVLEDCGAGLEDLVPGAVGLAGEAESISADDGAVLKDDVVAELAVLADYSVGVGEEIISGSDVGVDDDVRQKDGVVAEGDVVGDDDVGADVGVAPDFGSGGDDGGGVNAGGVRGRLVEELDGAGEGEVGVFDAEGGGGDFGEGWLDEDRRCLGGAGLGGVFWVCYEGKVAGGGGVDGSYSGDFGGGIAHEGGSQVMG